MIVLYYMPKPYHITKYTYRQAKRIGVKVKPTTNSTKKIDVYRGDEKIASVGARGMNDFPSYMLKCSNSGISCRKYALTRRKQYKIRHEKDRHKKWSRGWLADQLLW